MQTKLLTAIVGATLVSVAAAQQTPAVASAPQVAAPAPVIAPAPAAQELTTSVTQVVHTPQLPDTEALRNAAQAQGWKLTRVVKTPNQTIAFYLNPQGQESTIAYQTLPPAAQAPAPAPAPVATVAPAPTVVYQTAPRVIYYDDYPSTYVYPRYYYPPVSFSFGFGYRSFGGGYHGGHRHWR